MAMEKRGSVPVTPTTTNEDMVKTASTGIIKCSKCGGMYLSEHGSCPHCK